MPKITGGGYEVLADDPENAVLGDAMTVDEPARTASRAAYVAAKTGARRRRKSKRAKPARRRSDNQLGYELGYELNDDLGLFDMGVSRALVPYKPQPLAAPEDDKDETARLLVIPQGIAAGAVKGAVYGALLGNGTTQRRIGGGAIGGAVAFPALTAIAGRIKAALAAKGSESKVATALLDDAAHVGGATVSVVAAGGEAEDGAIAGATVCVAAHVLSWIVGR